MNDDSDRLPRVLSWLATRAKGKDARSAACGRLWYLLSPPGTPPPAGLDQPPSTVSGSYTREDFPSVEPVPRISRVCRQTIGSSRRADRHVLREPERRARRHREREPLARAPSASVSKELDAQPTDMLERHDGVILQVTV